VTDTQVFIGVGYAVNSGAANAAIGASGIDAGDDRRNTQIVIDDINANGGVAGRKLVPVWFELDATSPQTVDQQYQAVCETLTKDNKIFVAIGGGESETFQKCLHEAGAVAINDDLTGGDKARIDRYPYFWDIGTMHLDRIASTQVQALAAQGYFSSSWNTAAGAPLAGKPKTGVVTFDTPSFNHAVDQTLVPALARQGARPDPSDVIRAPAVRRTSDAGAVAAAMSNAVLKFRSSGVTHVIILDESGVLTLLFGNNAESQGYRPRYAANTQNGFQAFIDQGAYPQAQLNGTVGIGWLPGIDITPAENPHDGPYSNDTRRRCIELYRRNGVSYDSANAATIALGTCNTLGFFRHVMRNVAVPNRDNFRAAANRVGTSWESPSHFLVRIDADHRDGIGAYRNWAYRPECGCMRYTSGNILVP
jgi:ABC-type branched-subunit amino acid transport system substrate-binding protein